MSPLPDYRPKHISLGPLETEILNYLWELDGATAKEIHDKILADPNRELTYSSVTTVLQRLTQKGWLISTKKGRIFYWHPRLTRSEAQAIQSYDQLHLFLKLSNPDLVASFADSLDIASLEQIEAIANRLESFRRKAQESE